MDLLQRIFDKKIVAIVRGVRPEAMERVAGSLLDGGVSMMEVTFDHSCESGIDDTLASITLVREKFGGVMAVGAGTVLAAAEAEAARERGAEFIISPNVDPDVIAKTKELGMLSMPGAFTPTEVVAAHKMGADIVKLFPAGVRGLDYIQALRGPLPHIPLAAVGGVTPENLAAFLRAGVRCAGIGSNLVNAGRVAKGDFESIAVAARAFVAAAAG